LRGWLRRRFGGAPGEQTGQQHDEHSWFLILSVDTARIRGITSMEVFAAALSTPTRRSPPSAVLVGRRMRVAEQGARTVRQTTTQPVRSIKAQQHRKTAHVS
jgi:hypothetical protein